MWRPGQTVVWMQSVDPIYADFTVTEADFGRLMPRLANNRERFSAYPDETFKGEIVNDGCKDVDASSRMITVRGKLANPDGRLVPGMYADVDRDRGAPETVVTVPQTAVTYSLYGDSVFVVMTPKAKKRIPRQGGESRDRAALRQDRARCATAACKSSMALKPASGW